MTVAPFHRSTVLPKLCQQPVDHRAPHLATHTQRRQLRIVESAGRVRDEEMIRLWKTLHRDAAISRRAERRRESLRLTRRNLMVRFSMKNQHWRLDLTRQRRRLVLEEELHPRDGLRDGVGVFLVLR